MELLSVTQYAELHGVSERTVRNYCATGRLEGAFCVGKRWNIPAQVPLPRKCRTSHSALLKRLTHEMLSGIKGGIYHRIQVEFTYNSNHIEGSRLTKEQTRYIFETNTLGIASESTNVDDIVETVNHFRCIDYVITHACERISESHIKQLHLLLKSSTSDSRKQWFATGAYKKIPNEVAGADTTAPKDVKSEMRALLSYYNALKCVTLNDILEFHVRFERIHPFQDGNGRVGRLLMLWQCLQSGVVPFIITEQIRYYYYRGLQQWGTVNGYLTDTVLTAQEQFEALMRKFDVK